MEPVVVQNEAQELCILHDYIFPVLPVHLEFDKKDDAIYVAFEDGTAALLFEKISDELEALLRTNERILLIEVNKEHEPVGEHALPVRIVGDTASSFF